MDFLDAFGPGLRTRGRAADPPAAAVMRPLNEADVALLSVARRSTAPAIKRIRDSHHAVARLLAIGQPNATIMAITGYSGSRISILKADPTFQELVAHYSRHEGQAFADLRDRMTNLSLDVVQELTDRFNDSPEDFSEGDLMDLLKLLADRTGHGPQTKSTNVNVNVDLAQRLEAARRRAGLVEGELSSSSVLPLPVQAHAAADADSRSVTCQARDQVPVARDPAASVRDPVPSGEGEV